LKIEYQGLPHGFLYAKGIFTPLNPPGASFSYASAINKHGQIVGVDDHGGAYLYNAGVFTPLRAPGASTTVPFSINDRGQIVGYFDTPSEPYGEPEGFIATPTKR
jgi:uncharacterized membrane protein